MTTSSRRLAIVTGASRGIGRAVALRLAQDGVEVVVTYDVDSDGAHRTVEMIRGAGGAAVAERADAADVSEVRRLFAEVCQRYECLDVLVTNAGYALYKPVIEATEQDFDAMFNLHAKGTFFAMQEAVRRMREGGQVIAVSSLAARGHAPGSSFYSGAKAALEQFVRVLAQEVGQRGITVNAVDAGYTDTRGLAGAGPLYQQAAVEASVFKRLGRPEDIAALIAFLASEDAGWVTGEVIGATGGAF